jgi:hypothetical protein
MCLRHVRYHREVSSLVRSGPPADDMDVLRSRILELEALLRERAAEIDRVRSELGAFKIHYEQQVGWLPEELDELERAIAEAELDELSKREDIPPPREPRAAVRREPQPRYTSDAVRKLFRDVAKAIHPDLAADAVTRDRRHALMIEANRAYALGDEERLRRILHSWERRPEAVRESDPEAARTRLVRRIGQLDEQLAALNGDLDALQDSPTWKLKRMVDEAAAQGKDLIREMVGRLRVDVMVARNRLEAIQSTP